MTYLLAFLMVTRAHGGIIKRVCERYLVSNEYLYADDSDESIDRSIQRIEIKAKWRKLSEDEKETLEQLLYERRFRDRVNNSIGKM